jgi:hypothetical protein
VGEAIIYHSNPTPFVLALFKKLQSLYQLAS